MFTHQIDSELTLRLLDNRHSRQLFTLVDKNRSFLRNFLPWLDQTQQCEDSRKFIRDSLNNYIETGTFVAGIWFQSELVGVIGYNEIDWQHQVAVLGYWLSEDRQGKGIMTKACQAMLDHAFREYQMKEVLIYCSTNNLPSQKIANRLGFIKLNIISDAEWLYDHYVDHQVNSLTKDNYLLQNK